MLKPCPFCGLMPEARKPPLWGEKQTYELYCTCGRATAWGYSPEEAEQRWNQRWREKGIHGTTKLDPSWDDVPNGITNDIKDTKESPLNPSCDDVPDGREVTE